MTTVALRRPRRHFREPASISAKVELWLLRLLVPLGGHRQFIQLNGFHDEPLAQLLGLGKWIGPEADEFNPKAVRAQLSKLHREAESQSADCCISVCLDRNIARLAELVGLSDTDRRILEFVVMLKSERLLDDTADWLGELSSAKAFHVLAVLLDVPETDVREALSGEGVLTQSGLVVLDRSRRWTLNHKLDVLSESFVDHIVSSEADPVVLLRDTVAVAGAPQLALTDYPHIGASLPVLRHYLRQALASGRKGVNVFLYGAPGTGKSELAKVLAEDIECALFEVAAEDDDGDPINGERRLRAFRAAQSFFAQRRALLVFDEVEDVFNDSGNLFMRKSTAQARKAWVNRMLEANPVPTLWLSNSAECLDPAFLRRFDMVIELPVPPKAQREKIIQSASGGLLDAGAVSRVAESAALAPAVVTRAASVVRSIATRLEAGEAAAAMELLIDNTLAAQGHGRLAKTDSTRLPEIYDPTLVNADVDLNGLAAGLVHAKAGRLCLYGAPGTGKTAYGRWLAGRLGVPLHVKRASDLMSKWVGESEQNIAGAFLQAEREGALLLIDEVDSFLQDRRGAQRGWEVTLVNEMLTQMEAFAGVFVASTNLMSGLDQAALRRFDLKVRFDPLRPDQAIELLRRHCRQLGLCVPPAAMEVRLGRLGTLTPGDFAAVARRHRFGPIGSAEAFVAALEAECALKESPSRAVGFI